MTRYRQTKQNVPGISLPSRYKSTSGCVPIFSFSLISQWPQLIELTSLKMQGRRGCRYVVEQVLLCRHRCTILRSLYVSSRGRNPGGGVTAAAAAAANIAKAETGSRGRTRAYIRVCSRQ